MRANEHIFICGLIAKVSVTNNLRQREVFRENSALVTKLLITHESGIQLLVNVSNLAIGLKA